MFIWPQQLKLAFNNLLWSSGLCPILCRVIVTIKCFKSVRDYILLITHHMSAVYLDQYAIPV